jgi:fermentation-respiration switch protein FrsA (DUF1100 family)
LSVLARGALAVTVVCGAAVGWKVWRACSSEMREFRGPPRPVRPRPEVPELVDVEFRAEDGTVLAGWALPSRNGAGVVFAHGSPGDRSDLWPEALGLHQRGFGTLVFDLPGYGRSGGPVDWDRGSTAAVLAAVRHLAGMPGVHADRVGAFGFSLGTIPVLRAAAASPGVRAVAVGGTPARYAESVQYERGWWGPITGLPALWTARVIGVPVDRLRADELVAGVAPRPLLILHGTRDPAVPPAMAQELYLRASQPKELFMIPDGGHGEYVRTGGEVYLTRVGDFFERALVKPSAAHP